jgi:hypothetical protein
MSSELDEVHVDVSLAHRAPHAVSADPMFPST